jgi:hypothetical protein
MSHYLLPPKIMSCPNFRENLYECHTFTRHTMIDAGRYGGKCRKPLPNSMYVGKKIQHKCNENMWLRTANPLFVGVVLQNNNTEKRQCTNATFDLSNTIHMQWDSRREQKTHMVVQLTRTCSENCFLHQNVAQPWFDQPPPCQPRFTFFDNSPPARKTIKALKT